LCPAENDLVEARVIELRETPDLLGDRTYDRVFRTRSPGCSALGEGIWPWRVARLVVERVEDESNIAQRIQPLFLLGSRNGHFSTVAVCADKWWLLMRCAQSS
jgi:hypothetical protein